MKISVDGCNKAEELESWEHALSIRVGALYAKGICILQ